MLSLGDPQPFAVRRRSTIEQILRTNQVWLSNPLYLNDPQEIREEIRLAFNQ
jgi:hypothetical protein